jgi:hypothetical protein
VPRRSSGRGCAEFVGIIAMNSAHPAGIDAAAVEPSFHPAAVDVRPAHRGRPNESTTDVSTCRSGIVQYSRSSSVLRASDTASNPYRS